MPTVPERYFVATDRRLQSVVPTWWGAVVTDDRFPDVYDLNYARVTDDGADPGLDDVLADLEPALREHGSQHVHMVVLAPGGSPRLVEEAARAGIRVSADTVMEFRGPVPPADGSHAVEEADPSAPWFPDLLRRAYREFDVTQEHVVEQLLRWNQEVLAPTGRRYFVARRDGEVTGTGSIHLAGGVAYVDDIVTFQGHRRQGVATAVVRRLVREAAAAGADATFLLADEPNPIRLYRSLGFAETGRIRSLLGPTSWSTPVSA
jgi:ribosomal protein S18 acetylase RimI-like enzyme